MRIETYSRTFAILSKGDLLDAVDTYEEKSGDSKGADLDRKLIDRHPACSDMNHMLFVGGLESIVRFENEHYERIIGRSEGLTAGMLVASLLTGAFGAGTYLAESAGLGAAAIATASGTTLLAIARIFNDIARRRSRSFLEGANWRWGHQIQLKIQELENQQISAEA